MLRMFVLLIFMLFVSPVYAGVYEDAIKNHDKVAIYFYTPSCPACKSFNPYWQKIGKLHSSRYKMLKLNAGMPYGSRLSNQFDLKYVPSVVLVDSYKMKKMVFDYFCITDMACLDEGFKNFQKL